MGWLGGFDLMDAPDDGGGGGGGGDFGGGGGGGEIPPPPDIPSDLPLPPATPPDIPVIPPPPDLGDLPLPPVTPPDIPVAPPPPIQFIPGPYSSPTPPPGVPPGGLPPSPSWGGISPFSGFNNFLAGAALGGILNSIFGWITAALSSLWGVIVSMVQAIGKFLGGIGTFLSRLWNGFFKSIFSKLWAALKAAHVWLETHLRPLINFLKKLRAWLQRYYNIYVRPMLVMIQRLRQYLQILSLLHIRFAQKLDAYLAQLQARIVQSFATVIATVNAATDVLNALVDPTYLIRKPALLLSIRRQLPALIHAITGRPPGYWFPSPKGSKGGPFAPPGFPFNFRDPSVNPPTSSYLGADDGIADLGAPGALFTFTDGSVDAADPLDYFNDDLYPSKLCPYDDASKCLLYSWGINA